MATETLYISALDQNSGVTWTNDGNATDSGNRYGDAYARSSAVNDLLWGGFSLENTSWAPDEGSTDITSVLVRHKESNANHADDNFYLEFYDNHTSTWKSTIAAWPPAGFPSTLTTNDITSYVQTAYGSATDKRAFIDNFAVRLRCAKVKGQDGLLWDVAWAQLTYNYVAKESVTKSFTVDAFLKQQNVAKSFTTDGFLTKADTAYIDCGHGADATMDSDPPASNVHGTDAECSVEGPQGVILYEDGSVPGWEVCYETISGGTGVIAEGLGMDDNYGPAPIFPPLGDAKKYFGKTVNLGQLTYVGSELGGTGMEVRFSSLDAAKKYTITLLGMRGNFYPRWTEFAITVGSGWVAEHSSGTEPDWGGEPNGQTVTIKCGHNVNEGYVARWKEITPDAGGNIIFQLHGVAYSSSDPANKLYLSGMIITEAGTITYQELNRTVQATAAVSETDLQTMLDLNKTVQATAVVSCTDILLISELNRTVKATAGRSIDYSALLANIIANYLLDDTAESAVVVDETGSHPGTYKGINGDIDTFRGTQRQFLDIAQVSFVFDDNWDTDYDVMKSVFDAQGEVANCAVISDQVDAVSHTTQAELLSLQSAGWEMLSHTKSHPDLTTLSEGQKIIELRDSKAALEAMGLNISHVAYPGGQYDDATVQVAKDYYKGGRGIIGQTNRPILDTYALTAYAADDHTAVAARQGYVDTAETLKRWLIFYLHATDANDATAMNTLIDYIQAKSIPIVTISEGFALTTKLQPKIVSALSFDGTYNYVTIPDHADFSPLLTPFSISAFIYMIEGTNFYVASKGVINTSGEWRLATDASDRLQLYILDNSEGSACRIGRYYSVALSELKWLHVVATYDGGDSDTGIKLYLNGVRVDDYPHTAGAFASVEALGAAVEIGRYSTTESKGVIDDVTFFDKVLSLAEIKSIYAQSFDCTDALVFTESERTVQATAVVTCSDSLIAVDFNKTVQAEAVVSCTDAQSGTIVEVGRTVQADVTVTCSDLLLAVDYNKTAQAIAVVTNINEAIWYDVWDELVINGVFDDWAATDPDDWAVTEAEGSYVTEVGQGQGYGGGGSGYCNLYSSATLPCAIAQTVPIVAGRKYAVDILVDTITTNGIRLEDVDGTPEFSDQGYTTTGQKGLVFTAAGDHIDLYIQTIPNTVCDATIDNVSVHRVITADAVVSCSDDLIVVEEAITAQATAVVACTDLLIAAEPNRTVTADAVIIETDVAIFLEAASAEANAVVTNTAGSTYEELDRTLQATAVVTCSDALVYQELLRTAQASAVITETDLHIGLDNVTVVATAVVTESDLQEMKELNCTITFDATTSCVDALIGVFPEPNRTVQADAVVSCTDNLTGLDVVTVQAAAVVIESDVAVFIEPSCTVTFDAVTSCTDSLQAVIEELNRTVQAVAATSCVDVFIGSEIGKTVQADAFVSETDIIIGLETNRTVQASVVVTEVDLTVMTETLLVSAGAVATETDLGTMTESLSVSADAVTSCVDVLAGQLAIAAFVIMRQCTN